MASDHVLERLNRLVGSWTTEATHPAVPGVIVHGTVDVEWLEGRRFLIHRARTDNPDFPDSLSVIGNTDQDRVDSRASGHFTPATAGVLPLTMHYFDSRGVFRVFNASFDDSSWRIWRDAPGFSQRFTGAITDGGDTIAGHWRLSRDDINWDDDLRITYRRRR